MPTLAENHYGKSRVRLVKVTRHATHHDVFEWTLGVYLTGDFDACYTAGDNSTTLTTDTMKNTVYRVARTSAATTIEAFALELGTFLQGRNPQATTIRITAEEKMWQRIKAGGDTALRKEPHPTAFLQRGPDVATTTVVLTPGAAAHITSGIRGLVILKTAQSAFHSFIRDELTTLPESTDRLLATEATIDWIYTTPPPANFATTRAAVMDTLLTTFANHDSLSVQHTLYAMAEAALAAHPELLELTLEMPNRHNIPANLGALGSGEPNIFIPTDEPHGLIHARVTR